MSEASAVFSTWIDTVVRATSGPLGKMKGVRRFEVIEDEDGGATMRSDPSSNLPPCQIALEDEDIGRALPPEWTAALRGSVVELVLRQSRFLFREIELPGKAVEFLDGIVRAQIDRLTPWNAPDAIYHWTAPRELAGERIGLTVVATSRATAAVARKFFDLGASCVEISTEAPDRRRVTVYKRRADGLSERGKVRVALIAVLAASTILAALSVVVGRGLVSESYESQRMQVQQRISDRRAVMRAGRTGAGNSRLDAIVQRKRETPSSVLVIESLSALLPEHTYATELRIEGSKLQIVGITRDAPSLIQLLERSPHVASAGFFAPTTRSGGDAGERFHIEARLKPHFELGT
jgi:general secretion pathway protein L